MYYPVMLNLENKKVVVFGGGRVAARKLKNLVRSKANISLVSPKVISSIESMEAIEIIRDIYREEYLEEAYLVIAATSKREVNLEIALECEKRNILSNIVDSKEDSSFITPAIVDTESLLFSISTKGSYPALSKLIRKDLETRYSKYDREYMGLLEKVRAEAIENYPNDKEELIKQALSLNIEELEEFYIKLQDNPESY